jgi:hypothetical protein
MKAQLLLCLVSGLLLVFVGSEWHQQASNVAINDEQVSRDWGNANYRGLIIGKSTRADLRRIFGRLTWAGNPAGQSKKDPDQETWYEYESNEKPLGQHTITVAVSKKSGKIASLWLSPESLSKAEAIKYYGTDYVVTRYTFCEGFEGEDAPIYESEDGQLLYLEYRSRGIALKVNYLDKVEEIVYVSKPIGLRSRNNCKWAREM